VGAPVHCPQLCKGKHTPWIKSGTVLSLASTPQTEGRAGRAGCLHRGSVGLDACVALPSFDLCPACACACAALPSCGLCPARACACAVRSLGQQQPEPCRAPADPSPGLPGHQRCGACAGESACGGRVQAALRAYGVDHQPGRRAERACTHVPGWMACMHMLGWMACTHVPGRMASKAHAARAVQQGHWEL